ncbi:MAG: DUF177 domain-containing protein [Acidobacteriota bacterium]
MFIKTRDLGRLSRALDLTFSCSDLEEIEGARTEVHLVATVRRDKDRIHLKGHLESAVTIPCARCDQPFIYPVHTGFDLFYLDSPPFQPADATFLMNEDCMLADLDDLGRIDLLALAREQIYLSLPLKPVCALSCKGLCCRCGRVVATTGCPCAHEATDPRWAGLAKMRQPS